MLIHISEDAFIGSKLVERLNKVSISFCNHISNTESKGSRSPVLGVVAKVEEKFLRSMSFTKLNNDELARQQGLNKISGPSAS